MPLLRLCAGALLLSLLPVSAAWAHAQLLSSNPVDNAVLDAPPAQIELVFNEPVSPLAIRLIDADGQATDLTDNTTGGETTTVALPETLSSGTQVLSWRVVSADGHPVGGTMVFSIGTVTGAASVETNGDDAVSVLLWASKALLYIALFGGVGGALFGAFVALPETSLRLSANLCRTGLVLVPVTLGLHGADALGLSPQALSGAAVWSSGLSTSYGATSLALFLSLSLALIALTVRGLSSATVALTSGLVAALSIALSGHASAAAPQWLTRPAVFLHIAALLFWVGALAPLLMILRDRSDAGARALARFSRTIPLAVAPLLVSGVILGTIQMGPPGATWLSPYGLVLAAKLGLLCILFALALWNRLALTRPAQEGQLLARLRLRRSILAEMIIIVAILGLVSGWRFTPPPRALADSVAATMAAPITEHLIDGDTMAMVTLTPGSAGPVDIEIFVGDLDHLPRQAQAVTLTMAASTLGIEPIRREAVLEAGLWHVRDFVIPLPGTWTVEAEIRLSRFSLARPKGEIVLP